MHFESAEWARSFYKKDKTKEEVLRVVSNNSVKKARFRQSLPDTFSARE